MVKINVTIQLSWARQWFDFLLLHIVLYLHYSLAASGQLLFLQALQQCCQILSNSWGNFVLLTVNGQHMQIMGSIQGTNQSVLVYKQLVGEGREGSQTSLLLKKKKKKNCTYMTKVWILTFIYLQELGEKRVLTILHPSGTVSSNEVFTACSSSSRPCSVRRSWCVFSSPRSWVML